MFGSVFYHNSIRKYINLFGNFFNDIVVRRFNSSGNTIQSITVPVGYAGKQKYIRLLKDVETAAVSMQLPRISFQLVNIQLDKPRLLQPLNKNKIVSSDQNSVKTTFAQIPYLFDFELSIFSRNYDDAAQIWEQIAPYFVPTFSAELILVPEIDLKYDIITELMSQSIQDEFEGDATETRKVMWTLNFTMKGWILGPVSTNGVIKRAIVDLIPVGGAGPVSDEEVLEYGRQERITLSPGLTVDGQPTSNSALTIPYNEINADDPYGYIEELENFSDGLKWDPKTGLDK